MTIPNRKTKESGFTLIELMVTILLASVVFLGVAVVLADGIKGYDRMFRRIHGDVVNDAYFARLKFDKICRMSRSGSIRLDPSVPSLQVLYYSTPNVNGAADLEPNRYAQFYLNGTDLMLGTGTYDPETDTATQTDTQIVAGNVAESSPGVSSLKFSAPVGGKCCQMVMTLADSDHSITITCSSIMHN